MKGEAYEHFLAEMALGRSFQNLSREQQAVLGLATLLCMRDDDAWVEVSYLAQSLSMPEGELRRIVESLHELGLAWLTGQRSEFVIEVARCIVRAATKVVETRGDIGRAHGVLNGAAVDLGSVWRSETERNDAAAAALFAREEAA